MGFVVRVLLRLLRWTGRSRQDLILGNLAVRHPIAVLERTARRPALRDRGPAAWVPAGAGMDGVAPASPQRAAGDGRGRAPDGLAPLRALDESRPAAGAPASRSRSPRPASRRSRENPRWGSPRIVGERRALGRTARGSTVRRYRRQLGSAPSPTGRAFLRLPAHAIGAGDCFPVQTLTLRTLDVFLCISHDRRRPMPWDGTAHPTAPWVWQPVIHAPPGNTAPPFLLRDRDRNDGGDCVRRAARLGIRPVLPPVQAPQANAIAERVVRTVRQECLDHVIVLNDRHLRCVRREFVPDYTVTRPHRRRNLEPPAGARQVVNPAGRPPEGAARSGRIAPRVRVGSVEMGFWHPTGKLTSM